jgi:hypothetical protein
MRTGPQLKHQYPFAVLPNWEKKSSMVKLDKLEEEINNCFFNKGMQAYQL